MKKIHMIIIGMLVAVLTAAGVFCTVAWRKNQMLQSEKARLESSLSQAESALNALEVQTETGVHNETETETQSGTKVPKPKEPFKNGKKIAIDPGHQSSQVDMSDLEPLGPNSTEMKAKASTGTTGRYTGVPEYELNLNISKQLRTELEARGYDVVLTREDNDTAISNKERALLAYDAGADIYVRIHANGSEDSSVCGAMTMVPSKNNPYVAELHEESYKLGGTIIDAYCAATGMENDGVHLYDNMTGINWSKLPVVILEMGYMTNEADDTNMQDKAYQKKMVTGIADGIDDYFGFEHNAADGGNGSGKENDNDSDAGKENDNDSDAGKENDNGSGDSTENSGISEVSDSVCALLAPHKTRGETWAVYAAKADGSHAAAFESQKMQAASLIKLFIMGAVCENYDALAKNYGSDRLDSLLEPMITVSDNDAANTLTKMLGGGDAAAGRDIVNEFCAAHGYADTSMGRMLLETNPSGDNYTSVTDCGRFLHDVYSGSLLGAQQMTAFLKGQQRTGKIPAGVPKGVVTANKTGELSDVENDAAIVYAKDGAYILCVMSEDLMSVSAAQQTIINISEQIYEEYK